jgi:hypothetical protein
MEVSLPSSPPEPHAMPATRTFFVCGRNTNTSHRTRYADRPPGPPQIPRETSSSPSSARRRLGLVSGFPIGEGSQPSHPPPAKPLPRIERCSVLPSSPRRKRRDGEIRLGFPASPPSNHRGRKATGEMAPPEHRLKGMRVAAGSSGAAAMPQPTHGGKGAGSGGVSRAKATAAGIGSSSGGSRERRPAAAALARVKRLLWRTTQI